MQAADTSTAASRITGSSPVMPHTCHRTVPALGCTVALSDQQKHSLPYGEPDLAILRLECRGHRNPLREVRAQPMLCRRGLVALLVGKPSMATIRTRSSTSFKYVLVPAVALWSSPVKVEHPSGVGLICSMGASKVRVTTNPYSADPSGN